MKARSPSLSIPTKRSKSRRAAPNAGETWTVRRVLAELKRRGTRRNVEGMARFGIRVTKVYGVPTPALQALARKIGKNHALGLALWDTGIHDAKALAGLICDPRQVTAALMEQWGRDFENWADCDGACCHLFALAAPAWDKALAWTCRELEFEKRAGFALAAYLAVHDKAAADEQFERFLAAIERESADERNFVKKTVNWALRSIGKRNKSLNRHAIACAERIREKGTRASRWIAADALRELRSETVQTRLRRAHK